eukprot:scaffold69969_cov31-Phaeocystis_antarctica.AAC.1
MRSGRVASCTPRRSSTFARTSPTRVRRARLPGGQHGDGGSDHSELTAVRGGGGGGSGGDAGVDRGLDDGSRLARLKVLVDRRWHVDRERLADAEVGPLCNKLAIQTSSRVLTADRSTSVVNCNALPSTPIMSLTAQHFLPRVYAVHQVVPVHTS